MAACRRFVGVVLGVHLVLGCGAPTQEPVSDPPQSTPVSQSASVSQGTAAPDGEERTANQAPPESPPQRPPPPPKGDDYFFRPGYWRRVSGKWAWEAPSWVKKQAGRFWVDAHWAERGAQWVLLGARWKDELPECAPPPVQDAVAMVKVPGGTFKMGSDTGPEEERPAHSVTVAAFSIDLTEVTMARYAACVQAGKCSEPTSGGFCTWKRCGRDNHPINCVDHKQATAYCAFVGKRLPTEAEWEYAARGTDGRTRSWKAAEGTRSCSDRHEEGTCPVGAHPADVSPFGVLDIADSVSEWTSSPACGYVGECESGPPGTEAFVVRTAGSWGNPTSGGDTAARLYTWLEATSDKFGFRCAQSGTGK